MYFRSRAKPEPIPLNGLKGLSYIINPGIAFNYHAAKAHRSIQSVGLHTTVQRFAWGWAKHLAAFARWRASSRMKLVLVHNRAGEAGLNRTATTEEDLDQFAEGIGRDRTQTRGPSPCSPTPCFSRAYGRWRRPSPGCQLASPRRFCRPGFDPRPTILGRSY